MKQAIVHHHNTYSAVEHSYKALHTKKSTNYTVLSQTKHRCASTVSTIKQQCQIFHSISELDVQLVWFILPKLQILEEWWNYACNLAAEMTALADTVSKIKMWH
jgi:hypothetical protein